MIPYIRKIVFLLLITITLYGCIDTWYLNEKDIVPKIVLNGIIEADSSVTIRISKTFPFTNNFLDNKSNRYTPKDTIANLLPEAKPIIYINGERKGEMIFLGNDSTQNTDGSGSLFFADVYPRVGDKVRIEVSAPGFEPVWAETSVPRPIHIHRVDTATSINNTDRGSSDGYIVPSDARSLDMQLDIAVENKDHGEGHYSICMYQEWIANENTEYAFQKKRNLMPNTEKETLFSDMVADDILRFFLEEGNGFNTLYFTDKLFVNKRYTLNLSTWGYYFHTRYSDGIQKPKVHHEPIHIEIASMSPELYKALKVTYSETGGILSFFSEPTLTFSNVHNGVGVLGARSYTIHTIEIPPYTGEY